MLAKRKASPKSKRLAILLKPAQILPFLANGMLLIQIQIRRIYLERFTT